MAPYFVTLHRLAVKEARQRPVGMRAAPPTCQCFRLAVDHVTQQLAVAPTQGAVFQNAYRWMAHTPGPHSVLYYEILDPSRVTVYAIAHTSRRPGYWLSGPGETAPDLTCREV